MLAAGCVCVCAFGGATLVTLVARRRSGSCSQEGLRNARDSGRYDDPKASLTG